MIHVREGERRDEPLCGNKGAYPMIEATELRRRIHTNGRSKVEPTICPKCFEKAWPPQRVKP